MKLLFITPGKLPVPSTSGGAVETLIQMLIDNNEKQKKYDITLISIFTQEAYEKSKTYKYTKFVFINVDDKLYKVSRGIRYLINRIPKLYIGNAYLKRVNKKLKSIKDEFDYVIVENSPQYGLILQKRFKNNLILHMHNDFLNEKTDDSKKILNCYAKVFSLSNYITKRISNIDKNYNNVFTLYNGVDLEKFNNKGLNFRNKIGISKNDFVYLYTGRIVEVKGVRELIMAFNLIKDKDSKLVIVGDMLCNSYKSKKYIECLKRISSNNNNVIFTGKVKYDEMPNYYRIANVGVIPSIWEEPFALTVIEHMGVGNPTIISNSGAMPELVNEECSIIVEKNENYVENLYKSMIKIKKEFSKYNSEEIIKQAKKFNSNIYCNKFDELITKGVSNENK